MRTLITGGTGFLGGHLTRHLLEQGTGESVSSPGAAATPCWRHSVPTEQAGAWDRMQGVGVDCIDRGAASGVAGPARVYRRIGAR